MITVTCENCGSRQQVQTSKIPALGIVLTCSGCSQGITVMPPDDDDDPLLEFGGNRDGEELLDLPAPAGGTRLPTPAASEDIIDLPTPAGVAAITDLPRPVASEDIIDLPAPAGHRGIPAAPQPTGGSAPSGLPSVGIIDLPTPVGHSAPDLLTPKSTRPGIESAVLEADNVIDSAEPLALDALEPQPPEALDFGDEILDLGDTVGLELEPLAPKGSGPQDVRPVDAGHGDPMDLRPVSHQGLRPVGHRESGPQDLAPVGHQPTMPLDLQPIDRAPGTRTPTPPPIPLDSAPSIGSEPLALDDLDLVPTETNTPPSGDAGVVDGLDLMPAEDLAAPSADGDDTTGGVSFDELDLSGGDELIVDAPPPEPSAPATSTLALDTGTPLNHAKISHAAPTVAKSVGDNATPGTANRRKRRVAVGAFAAVLVLGGGGFFAYTKIQGRQAQKARIASSLQATRDLLASDEPGHWDKADQIIRTVLAMAPKNSDAIGLRAQAKLAAILDEGTDREKRLADALAILNDGLRAGADGPEFDTAQALRAIVDNKSAEATRLLKKISQRDDKNMPLFVGWAQLANQNMAGAKKSFRQALTLVPNRVAALYGLALAQLTLDKKNRRQAKENFENILQQRTRHIGARAGLAMLVPRDDAGTRERRLKEILDSQELATGHPGHASLTWSLYGDEAYHEGRINDASERYLQAIKLDARNLSASIGAGLSALEQGKLPEARARLDSVLAQDPGSIRALIGLTRASLIEQKITEAHGLVGRALEASPQYSNSHLWNGHVLQAKQEVDAAKTAFEKAITLDSGNYDAHVALSQLLLADKKLEEGLAVLAPVKEAATGDARLANTLGTAYLRAKQPTEAEVWFRVALEDDENHVDARANLGVALEEQDKAGEAIAQLERAHKQANGKREDVALQLARVYERAGLYKQAAALYQAITNRASDRPTITSRAAAGRYYARRGEVDKAAALGNSIFTDNQQHPAGLFLQGLGLFAKGKLNDAKNTMQDAIALDPQPQYHYHLAQIYERQGALDDAMASYGQAIARDPSYVEPRVARANVRIIRREFSLALRDLEDTLKMAPRNARIHLGIGKCIAALGASARDRKKAIPHLQKATKLDPTLAESYYVLGDVYFDNDKRSETIRALKRFLDSTPVDPQLKINAYRMLWETYKARRKKHDACRTAREYLDLLPPGDATRGGAERFLWSC